MDRWILLLTAAIATLLVVVPSVYSVKCYSCISGSKHQGEECKNADEKYLVDCAVDGEGVEYGRNYTMCRIMVQEVEGDTRIVRSCATHGRPEKGCIDRTGTSKIKLRYCECLGDGCNSADRGQLMSRGLMTSLVILAIAAVFHL